MVFFFFICYYKGVYNFINGGIFMKRKGFITKVLSLVIAVAIAAMNIPFMAFAVSDPDDTINFGVISDIHYFAEADMGENMNTFIDDSISNASTTYLSQAVLNNALNAFAHDESIDYVLLSGDLTRNGEYNAHVELAARLEQFEVETGKQVIVVDGNHDINNKRAGKFANGEWENGMNYSMTPDQFKEVYKNLGYDLADHIYTAPDGATAGGLSYTVRLNDSYYLVVLDGAMYSADVTDSGLDEQETAGMFTDDLYNWALKEIKTADKAGYTVLGMDHFNWIPNFDIEDSLFEAFVLKDWMKIVETFADAGMHYAFSGHIHTQDIISHVNDNGETFTDIVTTSLTNFPHYYRTVEFATEGDKVTFNYETHDIDELQPLVVNGQTMPVPYKNTSFGVNFGNGGVKDFVMRILEYQLRNGFGKDIRNAGGLYSYLTNMVDFNELMTGLTNSELLGGVSSLAVRALLRSICNQVDKVYLSEDAVPYTMSILENAINKILDIKVSDYPSTKFANTLGFKSANNYGTIGDIASEVLAYHYSTDEDISDDPCMQNALENLYNNETGETILNTLIDVVLNDILGTVLGDIKIDPLSLGINGSNPEIMQGIIDMFQGIFGAVDFTGLSAGDVVAIILMTGIFGDSRNLTDTVRSYLDEYLTQSQYDIIDAELYRVVNSFVTDENPAVAADQNGTLVYNGKIAVTPTVEDLRLPSGVAVTFGEKSDSAVNISYVTKYSLTRTDIQIVPYSQNPDFSKGSTVKATINASGEEVVRAYPGVDLGFIGILFHDITVVRHTIRISGLEAGKKYSYRIGDASRGWWSDAGVIDTADNSTAFSFFHMTDPQAVTDRQYSENWAAAVKTAFSLHKNSDFILSTGDLVDDGGNFNHWQRMFNSASDNLMSTVFMTATGNHEAKGDNATVENFIISNLPEQDTTTGVYYSFDYNTAHFAILNTNALNSDGTLSDEQLNWLRSDMSASKKPWKFVALHKAPYSNGSHFDDDDVVALRTQLSTLMPELDIDMVFQGHDHVYLRTDVINNNEIVAAKTQELTYNGLKYTSKIAPDGTIYSINGTAGIKHYTPKDQAETDKLFPAAETVVDVQIPSYSYIQINGGNLYFDSYAVADGTEERIDQFAISKVITLEDGTTIDGTNGNKTTAPDGTVITPDNNNGGTSNVEDDITNTSGSSRLVTLVITAVASLAVIAGIVFTAIVIKRRREEA